MSDRILLLIPCYNCERQIVRVLEQFRSVPRGVFEEILVLDNRSTDVTIRTAIDALGSLQAIRFTVARNREN